MRDKALILLIILVAGVGVIVLSDTYHRDVRASNAIIADLRARAIDAESRAVEHEAKAAGLQASLQNALLEANAMRIERNALAESRRPEVIQPQVAALTPMELTREIATRLGMPGEVLQRDEEIVFTVPAARRNLEMLMEREIVYQELYYATFEIKSLRHAVLSGVEAIAEQREANSALRDALSAERGASAEQARRDRKRLRQFFAGGVALGVVIGFAMGR